MEDMKFIKGEFIAENTDFSSLIEALENAFREQRIEVPMRHHHDYENPEEGVDSTLLLMPSFNPGKSAGVKIVTVSPNNGKHELPSIQGTYIYLDPHKGQVKAILDAPELTVKRTAAASALASKYLSKPDASKLLMVGTGALAPNLIKAHAAVRPISEVFIWGRSIEKAKTICSELSGSDFTCTPISTIDTHIGAVDIISCATLSAVPLIKGALLSPGQHIDLVGAYKKNMRESDDDVIRRAEIYIDTYQGGLKESGDIVIPLQSGLLKPEDIKADLFELCSKQKMGRRQGDSITCFKSVGHALEDLVAATYYYTKFNQ